MAHNHGSVHEDGTEGLSGWLNSEEQVAQAIAASHRAKFTGFWNEMFSVPTA
jgi:hypothetical protein